MKNFTKKTAFAIIISITIAIITPKARTWSGENATNLEGSIKLSRDSMELIHDLPENTLSNLFIKINPKHAVLRNVVVWIDFKIDNSAPYVQDKSHKPIELSIEKERLSPLIAIIQSGNKISIPSRNPKTLKPENWQLVGYRESGSILGSEKNSAQLHPLHLSKCKAAMPGSIRAISDFKTYGHFFVVPHEWATVSDDDGKFILTGVPEDDFNIRLWHPGIGWLDATSNHPNISPTGNMYKVKRPHEIRNLSFTLSHERLYDSVQMYNRNK